MKSSSSSRSSPSRVATDWSEVGGFDAAKRKKLEEAGKALQKVSEAPSVLANQVVYVNGYTTPTSSSIRELVLRLGGEFAWHWSARCTVVLATVITPSKAAQMSKAGRGAMSTTHKCEMLSSQWIIDVSKSGKWKPVERYRLVRDNDGNLADPFRSEMNAKGQSNTNTNTNTTATTPNVSRYFSSSRLHHLSVLKQEMKKLLVSLIEAKGANPDANQNHNNAKDSFILHIDFDCFFASVATRNAPHLVHKPVAIGHSTSSTSTTSTSRSTLAFSTSDIACCNYPARSFGLHNGMWIGKALELCPELIILPYDFPAYREVSSRFYSILAEHCWRVEAVSIDEALVGVNGLEEAKSLASQIRNEVMAQTRCAVSVGIGSNRLLARVATKKAKPNNVACVSEIDPRMNLRDLPGVGWSTERKLQSIDVSKVGEILSISHSTLSALVGAAMATKLMNFARGHDPNPLSCPQPAQSISVDLNWGIRASEPSHIRSTLFELLEEAWNRLIPSKRRAGNVTLRISRRSPHSPFTPPKRGGTGRVISISKSRILPPFCDIEIVRSILSTLLNEMIRPEDVLPIPANLQVDDAEGVDDRANSSKIYVGDVRGLGISWCKLVDGNQNDSKQTQITDLMKVSLREKEDEDRGQDSDKEDDKKQSQQKQSQSQSQSQSQKNSRGTVLLKTTDPESLSLMIHEWVFSLAIRQGKEPSKAHASMLLIYLCQLSNSEEYESVWTLLNALKDAALSAMRYTSSNPEMKKWKWCQLFNELLKQMQEVMRQKIGGGSMDIIPISLKR